MKTLTSIARRPALVLSVLAAGACNGSDGPSEPPFGPGDLVYRLQANAIFYDFVDTTAGLNYRLRWLSDTTFSGLNCLGFRPLSVGADTGTFQFYFEGSNEGLIEENTSGVLDTVIGVFLSGEEGTHGAYKISATNELTLHWADAGADITRYFDPAADIRFVHPDTLRSSADLRFQGDSIRAQWDVRWVARQCAL
jgi:hypothetical protein